MSLEIFPTYPKIRADQIEAAVLDPLVAGLVNDRGSQTRAILDTIIRNAAGSTPDVRKVNGIEVNWDQLTEPGYYLITIEEGSWMVNNPPPVVLQPGLLLVLKTEIGDIIQIFIGMGGGQASRIYSVASGEWGPWFARSGEEWIHRIGLDPHPLDSSDYQLLFTFQPSHLLLWPGARGYIYVRVFGQMMYDKNAASSATSYIRVRAPRSNEAIVKAVAPGTYSLISPEFPLFVSTSGESETVNIEYRSEQFDPSSPPQLVGSVDNAPATYFIFTF